MKTRLYIKIAVLCFLMSISIKAQHHQSQKTVKMNEVLAQLDTQLQEKRPDFYAQLQPPLTNKEIEILEEKYNVQLPEAIQQLYLWKNGQQPNNYKSFVNNSVFEPLEVVLETASELTSMIGYDFTIKNWWNKHWLPVFSNGDGSHICIDLNETFTNNKEQLIEFWKSDNDRVVTAPSLSVFLQQLAKYYEETPKEKFDGYFDISESLKPYRQKFIVNEPIKNE